MVSIRGRVMYALMKLFYRRMVPPNATLKRYRQFANQPFFEPMPRGIAWETGSIAGIPGEWITPPNPPPNRVLMYLHGGGFVLRTPHVHRVLVGRLAHNTGVRAFMVDYRLAPEHPFPAALDDAETAYRGLLRDGYKASQIVLAGDSAGGGLTAALLLKLRDSGAALPAAAVIMSGMLDCTFSDASSADLQKHDPLTRLIDLKAMARHYASNHDSSDPLISPALGNLLGLPPLLVCVAEHEVLRPQSVRFADKAQAAGVACTLKVWDGMIHAFPLFAGFVPEGKAAIAEFGGFFRRHLGEPK